MSYVLFLDDERNPQDVTWARFPRDGVTFVARNYEQFVDSIYNKGMPRFVCFDHDLADFHYQAMLKDNEANRYTAFVPDDEGGLNLTFDYGKEKTGFDCAKWLVQYCIDNGLKFPPYVVHSMNPVGGQRIHDYIQWAKQKMDI